MPVMGPVPAVYTASDIRIAILYLLLLQFTQLSLKVKVYSSVLHRCVHEEQKKDWITQ